MNKKRRKRAAQSPWPFVVMAVGVVAIVSVGFFILNDSKANAKLADATPESARGARLSVDQTVIDFGKVKFNQPVTAVFKLKNIGDQPLRILGEPRVELVQGC